MPSKWCVGKEAGRKQIGESRRDGLNKGMSGCECVVLPSRFDPYSCNAPFPLPLSSFPRRCLRMLAALVASSGSSKTNLQRARSRCKTASKLTARLTCRQQVAVL